MCSTPNYSVQATVGKRATTTKHWFVNYDKLTDSPSFTPYFPSHTFSDNKGQPGRAPLVDPYPLQADAGLVNVSRREDSVHHLTMIRMQPRWVRVEPARSTLATHLHMRLKNATHGSLGSRMQETPISRGIMSSPGLYCMCHHQRLCQYVFHFHVGIQTERTYAIKLLKNSSADKLKKEKKTAL